jgi:hypothetical protein
MKTLGSPHLTAGYDDAELVRQIKQSVGGMAFFAATGPLGTQCKDCAAYSYYRTVRTKSGDAVRSVLRRGCCAKFYRLTGQHGDAIPPTTESCKYFERTGKQEKAKETDMSNLPIISTDDGWNDAAGEASERTIRGALLKFADWRWTAGKEATPVPSDTRLIAIGTTAAWIRWEERKPVEYRFRPAGGRLPERNELGHSDRELWELGPDGERVDPFRNTRFVYLVGPNDAAAYTFTTSSGGGRQAVADLGDQIARMRTVHPDAVPLVELSAADMPTKYGVKSRPVFKIVAWKTANGEAPGERQITSQAAQKAINHMDDEIPF